MNFFVVLVFIIFLYGLLTSFYIIFQCRETKVKECLASYKKMSTGMSNQYSASNERSAEASFKISWLLTRKKKPFVDSELIKDCMLTAVDSLVADASTKLKLSTDIQKMPMSRWTNARRITSLSNDVKSQMKVHLRETEWIALAVDESTDISDTAQLCLYVRYFDGSAFKEEMLELVPMTSHTIGLDVYTAIKNCFREEGLQISKVLILVTDGAPAMIGIHNGLVALWKRDHPNILSLHCIIHQTVLCAKLSGGLNDIMDNVMAIINFVRSNSSLQHRELKKFVADKLAEHADLLLHNDERWLSKGKGLRSRLLRKKMRCWSPC